jgi:hypothetical protein
MLWYSPSIELLSTDARGAFIFFAAGFFLSAAGFLEDIISSAARNMLNNVESR